MNSMPFRQLNSFLKILIGVQYELHLFVFCFFQTAVNSALQVVIKGPSGNLQRFTKSVDRILRMFLVNILQDK